MESALFRECEVCSVKPGSPILCEPCRKNRSEIERINREVSRLEKKQRIIKDLIELN